MGSSCPINSLLRIDMTCGMIAFHLCVIGLRPLETEQLQELMEACRLFHEMLDMHDLSTDEYVDWCDGIDISDPQLFTDILNRKLFREFGSEKLLTRKMLKRKRGSTRSKEASSTESTSDS